MSARERVELGLSLLGFACACVSAGADVLVGLVMGVLVFAGSTWLMLTEA